MNKWAMATSTIAVTLSMVSLCRLYSLASQCPMPGCGFMVAAGHAADPLHRKLSAHSQAPHIFRSQYRPPLRWYQSYPYSQKALHDHTEKPSDDPIPHGIAEQCNILRSNRGPASYSYPALLEPSQPLTTPPFIHHDHSHTQANGEARLPRGLAAVPLSLLAVDGRTGPHSAA